jgi:tRNA dimethylallyltransferase
MTTNTDRENISLQVIKPTLIVLLGPTGVGKTNISLEISQKFNAPIISSDSRQFYRELKTGTAAPTEKELAQAKHYFIGTHSIHDEYNAGQYEQDVIHLLDELFLTHSVVMLVGGSMMYVDAVCNGMDDLPTITDVVRNQWLKIYEKEGLEYIQQELQKLDPEHYKSVDLKNYKRVLHALEICTMTGKTYSEQRTGVRKERKFNILKIGLNRPRPELYERINQRVDVMMDDGLLEEARQYYSFKHLNTLNTVGYKELYQYMDGELTLDEAVQKIKQDSRRYAKRQLTWFNRDKEVNWFHPDKTDDIITFISRNTQHINT